MGPQRSLQNFEQLSDVRCQAQLLYSVRPSDEQPTEQSARLGMELMR